MFLRGPAPESRAIPFPIGHLIVSASFTVSALVVGSVIYLAVRHIQGAVAAPPKAAMVLFGVALAAGLAGSVRVGFVRSTLAQHSGIDPVALVLMAVIPASTLLLFGWVWTSAGSLAATSVAWIVVLAEESASLWYLFRQAGFAVGPRRFRQRGRRKLNSDEVLQQWTRTLTPQGVESLVGDVRLEFANGEQTSEFHVPFFPAFATVPAISVEQTSGEASQVRVAERQVYGARIEVRLPRPATQTSAIHLQVQVVHSPAVGTHD